MTIMPWLPPAIAGIGRSDALWNALVSYADTAIELPQQAVATFSLANAPPKDALCCMLATNQVPSLFVVWQDFPFASRFEAPLAAADLAALPPALRDALLEGMIALLRPALPFDWFDGAAITAAGPSETLINDPTHAIAWFDVRLEGLADTPVLLKVGCARERLLETAARRAILPRRVQEDAARLITVPCFHTLGTAGFRLDALQNLRAGTVIVLPTRPPHRRLLRIGRQLWELETADGRDWKLAGRVPQGRELLIGSSIRDIVSAQEAARGVTQAMAEEIADQDQDIARQDAQTQEAQMQDTQAANTPADETANDTMSDAASGAPGLPPVASHPPAGTATGAEPQLASLPIAVDFDLGQTDISLAELEAWQPGAIVALAPPPLPGTVEVTLRTNGRAIARGDLVSIDDRLAIRLSDILLHP